MPRPLPSLPCHLLCRFLSSILSNCRRANSRSSSRSAPAKFKLRVGVSQNASGAAAAHVPYHGYHAAARAARNMKKAGETFPHDTRSRSLAPLWWATQTRVSRGIAHRVHADLEAKLAIIEVLEGNQVWIIAASGLQGPFVSRTYQLGEFVFKYSTSWWADTLQSYCPGMG